MNHALEVARAFLIVGGALALILWGFVRWYKSSDDRPGLITKWILSAIDLAFIGFIVVPLVLEGGYTGAFGGIPFAAVGGIIMALIWTSSIAGVAGGWFGQLYDGGDVAPTPEAGYSIAIAKRKRGHYKEAAVEVENELERFPSDFRGWMLLAEICAEDLRDMAGAKTAVLRMIEQPGHTQKNVAFALTQLGDWYLRVAHDSEEARQAFQRIVDLFPDSAEAHLAHQRLAHMGKAEQRAGAVARPPIHLPHSDDRVGLRLDFTGLKAPVKDPLERASELVRQLERFPLDNQAREELAVLYAGELHRLDLATLELEQLIAQPHAPEGRAVHWLNLLADIQLQESGDVETARRTLETLIQRSPESAAAQAARRRLATLRLEVRSKEESQAVRLGSYEQHIGLKLKNPGASLHSDPESR